MLKKARHVDDEPYGGGQGMLLRAQPIFDAFDAIEKKIRASFSSILLEAV